MARTIYRSTNCQRWYVYYRVHIYYLWSYFLDDDDDNGGDELVVDEEGSAAGVAKKESVASTSGGSAKSAPTWVDYIMHFIAVPWKLLFALIPPTGQFRVILMGT
jgi:hypothetical protein